MKPIILILLVTMGCLNWSADLAAAEPTLKCEQYWGCKVEEALPDEFVAQQLPALKDRLVALTIERSKKVTDFTSQ